MTPRLKAHIWVAAYIRRCNDAGVPAMLRHRGDAQAGSVLIKLNRLDGTACVLSPSFGMAGERLWLKATGAAPVPEANADAYIAKRRARDPDLWVVEVETREGNAMLDEPVV
ncbi:MAG: DUF1491 family protein [Alphaproteobacteria bacterium]|nr:MAG: DUF1491 family protein [Alphaproteobacteria bacterium]